MAEPFPLLVDVADEDGTVAPGEEGVVIANPDGSVVVDISTRRPRETSSKFDDNLAMHMGEGELAGIAEKLLEGIDTDLQSRAQWEATRSRGIDLLGLKLEEPRSDVGSASAPLEGMSTIRDSTLLEAVLRSQANAIGELLPAEGPVKAQVIGAETTANDQQAEELEKGFNYYLTDVATEYYPDSKRMLFWSIFGGVGIKKVYQCPIRRRPVSESIDANDFIVSNAATDLWNAGRVTHRISMRNSVMKRMQVLGIYRDVPLTPPSTTVNKVEEKKQSIEGVRTNQSRPEDQPYTLYECYCELDLDQFAPPQFKDKAIPLPYRVTVEKDSRQILEIHRNWKEDDENCLPRKYFVRYPYVEGMGFYGIGLVHILGNAAMALTGAKREMLDAGQFANFPGFLITKQGSRQLSNEFRIPPGGSAVLESQTGRISDVAMPLPYKDVLPGLLGLVGKLGEEAQRLGGTADLPVGEGKQDAPVGTTLALIEQATKVESAVHKGMHKAQAEEFQLLKERFREDPESFARSVSSVSQWTEESFLAAMENVDLVPVADPNTPSHIHRIAKALAIKQLQASNPQLYDPKAVDRRVLAMIKVDDAESLFNQAPPQQGPDPNLITAQARLITAQTGAQKAQNDAANAQADLANQAAERESKENIETMKLAESMIVHSDTAAQATADHALAATTAAHDRMMDIAGAINQPAPGGP